VALAENVGLCGLVTDRVKITGADNSGGANAGAKVMTLLAGMVAGGDSIQDIDRLRLGGTGVAFSGVRAPSTLGTFLRSFTHGHVKQLHSVHKQVLIELARTTDLLSGAGTLAFVDVDSTHRQVYGYTKQGAENGRLKGKKTLHPLIAAISTPLAAPVTAGIRMRKGKAADVRGAAGFVAEALNTARNAGCTGRLVLRCDAKFYTADVVAAARRAGAFVSLTTGSNPSVNAAIASIPEQAWTPIHYPDAFVDEDTGHRGCEKLSLAHLPSSSFQANAAWATLWAIAHNLTRTTGVLADRFPAKATTATIRAHLINIPARLARSARRLTLHLPQNWPWQDSFQILHTALRNWPPRTI
jgi:hypothetical protein